MTLRLLPACALAAVALLCAAAQPAVASVSAVDDTQRTVTLPGPARRIVSLAPHTTEMLFAAGAGSHVVGVTEYSDYPPEAKRIASVGSGISLDLERILQLKPDLIVGWNNGSAAAQLAKLDALGIPVFRSEPHGFSAIATSLERLAHLAGTDAAGHAAAASFRARLQGLDAAYRQRSRLKVFYQIWRSPLMTLNDATTPAAVLRLCGAENIFGGLPQLAPTVSIEAVLKADPDVVIASIGEQDDVFGTWRRFPQLKAVARGNMLLVDGGILNRSGPRILDGAETLCRQLDAVRNKR
ncbi:cobalamin-binding protein [Noviherbaspirillum sp. UKPF54]|uniref:cobalamin-binding protein n=1 Tax=Noviherbaspirillum sp. UKPF54 TaxID=2601898 RepID=UPI001AEF8F39|nr:cobalamin-binding protein [Noviherbaspirillum sp. UKPF54]